MRKIISISSEEKGDLMPFKMPIVKTYKAFESLKVFNNENAEKHLIKVAKSFFKDGESLTYALNEINRGQLTINKITAKIEILTDRNKVLASLFNTIILSLRIEKKYREIYK